jgi:uncharacterized protein YyaL (SSP411 family)
MISGLSRAASALDNPTYIEYAENTAKFIKRYLYDEQSKILLRSCYRDKDNKIQQSSVPIKGFQVDYAFVIQGLLDLYKVSFNPQWLEFAEVLQDIQDRLFWDEESGGYFSTTNDDASVILRFKDGMTILNMTLKILNSIHASCVATRENYFRRRVFINMSKYF